MNYTLEPLYGPNDNGNKENETAYQVLNKLRPVSSDCLDSLEHINLENNYDVEQLSLICMS